MSVVILNFHGVGPPARELEPGEAPYWISADFYEAIIARIAKGGFACPIEITFDDGNASDAEIGMPALEAHGLKAVFFALAGRIDQPGSLSRAQIKDMMANGHSIGTHGMDHVDWTKLDAAGQSREFETARAQLSDITGSTITQAAIPFGLYNRNALQALRRLGYEKIYSSDGGRARSGAWPQPRTSVQNTHSMADVEGILSGEIGGMKKLMQPLKTFIKSRI